MVYFHILTAGQCFCKILYICQKGIKSLHLLSEGGPTEILYYGNMKGVWDVTGLFVHWAEHYASAV